MDNDIYLHGVIGNRYKDKVSDEIETLKMILDSGAILSLSRQGRESNNGFNGKDFISLCDLEVTQSASNKRYTAFYNYVEPSISIAFKKSLFPVIKPIIVPPISKVKDGYDVMKHYGKEVVNRYSDFVDEVQVRDRISTDIMYGITFPVNYFLDNSILPKKLKYKLLEYYILEVKELLRIYDLDVPIFNINTGEEIKDDGYSLILK